jgi:pilus assembly protein CpaF
VDVEGLNAPERRLRVRQEVLAVLTEERVILPASAVTDVVNQVSDEVVGLGPIERLLKDPEVSEVMVNGADDVYVERKGRLAHHSVDRYASQDASVRLRQDLQTRQGHDQPAAAA